MALQIGDQLMGRSRLPFVGLAATGISTVLREWNDLEAALAAAQEGIARSNLWGQTEVVIHGYIELARVLQARGDAKGASDAVRQAELAARDLASWAIISIGATKARLHLRQGDLTAASLWAQESGLGCEDKPDFQHLPDYMVLARVLLAQAMAEGPGREMPSRQRDRLDEASRLLERLLETADGAGADGYAIEVLVLQAVTCQARGDRSKALASLTRALALGEAEGSIRTFVEAGPPMMDLLKEAAVRGTAVDYVAQLLTAFRKEDATTLSTGEPGIALGVLVEPLSERELEVLRLIVAGLSNKEIAQELILAVGTVKKHINNIYGKLGVNRRTQAARRAQELGLV